MTEQFVTMKDGTKIFTLVYDGGFDQTLLMLHGGPGASCDYLRYPAKLLAQHVNVVLFDQRGVRRSDAIELEGFDFQILIDDIDDIKKALNIEKWHVLGHSFGGLLALLYATKYQADVETVIFECPTFCYSDSTNYVIETIKPKLTEHGCFNAELSHAKEHSLSGLFSVLGKLPKPVVKEFYHPFPIHDGAKVFQTAFSSEESAKTKVFRELVMNNTFASENHFEKLKQLSMPSLLMVGEYDAVCSPKQQEAFASGVVNGETMILPNCGHTLHNEIPQVFIEKVLEFIER